jgi:hypothetical protein
MWENWGTFNFIARNWRDFLRIAIKRYPFSRHGLAAISPM